MTPPLSDCTDNISRVTQSRISKSHCSPNDDTAIIGIGKLNGWTCRDVSGDESNFEYEIFIVKNIFGDG